MSVNFSEFGDGDLSKELLESDIDVARAEKLLNAVFSPITTIENARRIENLRESSSYTANNVSNLPTISRFKILSVLGQGAFGIVYEAFDPVLVRTIAIKVARPHVSSDALVRARFFREIHLASKLHHPGIVQIFEAGEEGGQVFFVMELCKGQTLAHWLLNQPKPIPFHTVAMILHQTALAIAHGHEHGVVHRDLKPDNIMIDDSCSDGMTIRILDFGLAFGIEDSMRYTSSSTLLGTPLYMSPEQIDEGSEKIGPKSDVFALGAILYELLTNNSPFVAESLPKVIDKIRNDCVVAPRSLVTNVPKNLDAICMKCLRNNPSQRYETATDLASDLNAFLQGLPVNARSMTQIERVTNWLRHPSRVPEFGLGLVAINLLVLAWAILNYPIVMCLFPGSSTDTQTRDLFLPVVCMIIPCHGFMLWSSNRIYKKKLSRKIVLIHLVATVLMAIVSISVVCLTSNNSTLDMNRFERVATMGLMSTFAEVQAIGLLLLLIFATWPKTANA